MKKNKLHDIVIVTEPFMGIDAPYLAIIYEEYTIGNRDGYSLVAIYNQRDRYNRIHYKDLSGFSDEEMDHFTFNVDNIIGSKEPYKNIKRAVDSPIVYHDLGTDLNVKEVCTYLLRDGKINEILK